VKGMMAGERGRLMANVRQRYSFAPDYGGELGGLPSPASSAPPEPAPLRRTAENLLWLAAAAFAIYYGDSRHHLAHVLFYDPRIRRCAFSSSSSPAAPNFDILWLADFFVSLSKVNFGRAWVFRL
jgi:hypothetical protein